MILNDFIEPKFKFSHDKLDDVLAELCGLVLAGQRQNAKANGKVGAAVLDPRGRLVTGVGYSRDGKWCHGEYAAIENYEQEYGELPKGCIIITTLSPCNERHDKTAQERYGESCTDLLNSKNIKMAYCGYKDYTQDNTQNNFSVIITSNQKLLKLCSLIAGTFLPDLKESISESSGASKAQTFINQVYSQYPEWPYGQADRVMVWGDGDNQTFAAFKLKPGAGDNTVNIDWIMAGPEQRQGVGTRAIQQLQKLAREAGIKLTLYPWDKGRISQTSLKRFYKRQGFKPIAKGAAPMQWEPLDELKIDNKNGIGAVPHNQDVDYFGLRVKMKPSKFLELAKPMPLSADDKKTIQHLEQEKDNRGFGAPFLTVDMEGEFPKVDGHDGRHRMTAIKNTEGDIPVEVHIFPRYMRNRDLTPELIDKMNRLIISETGRYVIGPIFSQAVKEARNEFAPAEPRDDDNYEEPEYPTSLKNKNGQHVGDTMKLNNGSWAWQYWKLDQNPHGPFYSFDILGHDFATEKEAYASLQAYHATHTARQLREFAPAEPQDDDGDVPPNVYELANRWWNNTDDQDRIAMVLRSMGWDIQQADGEEDVCQLTYRDGTVYYLNDSEFDPDLYENFADGKHPGRKGLSKRMGVNTKASVSSLRKTAKHSSGEKARMAHWLANMKSGREKAKKK